MLQNYFKDLDFKVDRRIISTTLDELIKIHDEDE